MQMLSRTCALGFLLGMVWSGGFGSGGVIWGQTPEPDINDNRLSIHTLVREDIFAGWRAGDMRRFERGEKNIDLLLEKRPEERADLLAWKGGAKLFRAVLAHEAGDESKFREKYEQSRQIFAEARKLGPENVGTAAVIGGSLAMFTDRLPKDVRADAWSESYDNYRVLWKLQSADLQRMPLHISGELLAGLAQTAQRTGRQQELEQYLNQLIEVLPDSSYAREAKRWKNDPKLAAVNNITCKSCHAPGRLSSHLRRLNGK